MVAHNKPICTQLFIDTKEMVEKINRTFNDLEDKYTDLFKAYEDIEIENLWLEYDDEIETLRETELEEMFFNEAGIEPTPDVDDVIERITESHEFRTNGV